MNSYNKKNNYFEFFDYVALLSKFKKAKGRNFYIWKQIECGNRAGAKAKVIDNKKRRG